MVKPSYASTPTLSPPEFTLKLVDNSYDTPTSTSTNPYNGSTITRPSTHVENKTIELHIKNQPYNRNYVLFYDVRTKGHFEENWKKMIAPYDYPAEFDSSAYWLIIETQPLRASNSEFTVLYESANSYPSNAQVDFSVRALLYNVTSFQAATRQPTTYTLIAASDWSNTQTVNMTDGTINPSSSMPPSSTPAASTSQNPTSISNQSGSQTVPFLGLDWLQIATVALLCAIAVLLVVVVVFLHKRKATYP
ncbi:MAG: hypothetical protein NWE96_00065 [Candidatus Bathyarchaeota archaeon]|nr:hypothetical protein [Candidatus Bathyarchaeota archaeon]